MLYDRCTRIQQFALGALCTITPHIEWIVGMNKTSKSNDSSVAYLHWTHVLNEWCMVRCGFSKN